MADIADWHIDQGFREMWEDEMGNNDPVEVNGLFLLVDTKKAYGVTFDGPQSAKHRDVEAWLPKSMVEGHNLKRNDAAPGYAIIPRWLAEDKELAYIEI